MPDNTPPPQKSYFVVPAAILGISLILSTFIFSGTWKKIKSENQIITVTGSAKKVIVSDLGILRGTLNVEGPTARDAYRALELQKPVLLTYLKSKGFDSDKVNYQTISTYPNFNFNAQGQNVGVRSYNAAQTIDISSSDVNLIKEISLEISSLVERGVSFQVNSPEYYYTKLGDIKIEIQAQAAKDAMNRGERIAEATGRKLGTLKSARMGVLQITPENSNLTSDYGINDVSSIRKEIVAVVNANFEID
ncbi:MAG: SIMPL domain-containing protein [Daejeonella sp.]|uniref:SIMPL domain-containing protein n=1 Tax=Daejeonella sp. JGW-45 TaxID=3034148 RepID=UPI0023EC5544|nr:SIMPL domain-containing protein [Daejeonella sp. JGW-45]